MDKKWFRPHVAYTIAKYGMSMCVLGMAEEFRDTGIAVNALWPGSIIQTAALAMVPGVDAERSRTAEIMADAAHLILTRDARSFTGHFCIDEEILASSGSTDLAKYAVAPHKGPPIRDLFLD